MMSLYDDLETLRQQEYPQLKDEVYLDHAGTTLYAKSVVENFAQDMISNLYGNTHSASSSSQSSAARVDDTRLRVLQFFKADPFDFDVVFVANATAGIKLVADGFRAGGGFNYAYHRDAHTSLIGVRELSKTSRLIDDNVVEEYLTKDVSIFPKSETGLPELYAYPGQSNMDGRQLPLSWSNRIRKGGETLGKKRYVLVDAAALAATSPINLSNADEAPDFLVFSFNKIFGFPNLGAVLVRKCSGEILTRRAYFGGGTVDAVVASAAEDWHVSKNESLHDSLEDGTLPFDSIVALNHAMASHTKLFGSMDRISKHTTALARRLHSALKSLRHANGLRVCRMYSRQDDGSASYGPTVAFNALNSEGAWYSTQEVMKLAAVRKIHIRAGTVCNPCGLASAVGMTPFEVSRNLLAGIKCGNDNDVISGKPTGILRASIGAMTTESDVSRFIEFMEEFFVDHSSTPRSIDSGVVIAPEPERLTVRGLTIYPIKSCGAYSIKPGVDWEIKPEGLAWDREWCFVQQGTGQVLSQKRYPKMALLRPEILLDAGIMIIRHNRTEIVVSLAPAEPLPAERGIKSKIMPSKVCGDTVTTTMVQNFEKENEYFSKILGVQCALARFPSGGVGQAARHNKAHLQKHQGGEAKPPVAIRGSRAEKSTKPDRKSSFGLSGLLSAITKTSSKPVFGPLMPDPAQEPAQRPILLSNESPILLVNSASLNALNNEVSKTSGVASDDRTFRANIVVGSSSHHSQSKSVPYSEDRWQKVRIGKHEFTMLGACRRCHMICVDQETAERNEEPFVTLAKTRRFDGKVFFGVHCCLADDVQAQAERMVPTVRVGDEVVVTSWIGDANA